MTSMRLMSLNWVRQRTGRNSFRVMMFLAVVAILFLIEWSGSIGWRRDTVNEDPEVVRKSMPRMEIPAHLTPRFTIQSLNMRLLGTAAFNWAITRFDSAATGEFIMLASFNRKQYAETGAIVLAEETHKLLSEAGRATSDEPLIGESLHTHHLNVCDWYDPVCDSQFELLQGKGRTTGRRFWQVSGVLNTGGAKTLLNLRLRGDQWDQRKLKRLLNSINKPSVDLLQQLARQNKIRIVVSEQAKQKLRERNLTDDQPAQQFRQAGFVLYGENADAEPWPTIELAISNPDTTYFYRTIWAFDRSRGVLELLEVRYDP
jgi:hypothetical protein